MQNLRKPKKKTARIDIMQTKNLTWDFPNMKHEYRSLGDEFLTPLS